MVDAPERIWIDRDHGKHAEDWDFSTDVTMYSEQEVERNKVEYIRADLVAELAAENERLKQEAAEWEVIARDNSKEAMTHRREAEAMMAALANATALASTGAVQVKTLDEDDYEEITNAAGIAMRRVSRGIRGQVITVQDSFDWWVMKETERRILSALDTHPRATNTVESHETANMRDKPFGYWIEHTMAEPYFLRPPSYIPTGASYKTIPLYTRPSEQAVTEAARRVLKWVEPIAGDHLNPKDAKEEIESVEALKAAMEAGG